MRLNLSLLPLTILFALIAVASCATMKCAPVYVVEKGDTLEKIANKLKVPLKALIADNPCISNPDEIYPDCMVRIPKQTKCIKP
ncbi:Carbohydrate-Binding Module Family 50 protein [Rhizophagus diaphanus]|nr:Carbohydrate-Binding Module Family 50 protein [Rhizophagus diaphanus] [Rhizophagus sp. MUCL 43196]